MGAIGGTENVTLSQDQMPRHSHNLGAVSSTSGNSADPGGRYLATVQITGETKGGTVNIYAAAPNANTDLAGGSVKVTGGDAPHTNLQPFSVVNFCIATVGFQPLKS